MAIAGLSELGRDKYGVFPLKRKSIKCIKSVRKSKLKRKSRKLQKNKRLKKNLIRIKM